MEHQKAYALKSEESVMHEHEKSDHQGQRVEWSMKSQGFPKGNLKRQALEAHKIFLNEGNNLLNRRGEWGQNLPPRLEVDDQRQTIPQARGPGRRKMARKAQEGENPPPTEGQVPPETTTSPNMAQKMARAREMDS